MSGVNTVSGKTILLGPREVSRQTLLDYGARAATALDRIGVREGDAIALLIRNDPCYFEVIQAAAHLGAYVVPLNWHSTADEVGYILSDCTPRVLIGHAGLIERVAGVIPTDLPAFTIADHGAGAAADSSPRPSHARDWPAFRDQAAF
jgi:long-chain acyl-CoA synthetase